MTMPQNDPRHDARYAAQRCAESERQSDKVSATRDQLLAQVLSETLNRRHDDATMLHALRQWRATLGDPAFDSDLVQRMVPQVLRYRMGSYTDDIPDSLCQDVAAALWNDPLSRQRIERLWRSLETEQ